MKYTSFLLAFALLLIFQGFVSAFEHETDGDSGDTCGPEDRKCLEGKASCDVPTGECVCHNPPYAYGDGYVNCYKNNTFRTEVFNDPTVLTYNGNAIDLPLPCRYFWTHTRTYLKDRSRNRVGFCEFQAYAFHGKRRGKFFALGYDVAIRVTYDNGTEVMMSIRKSGKANDGDYSFVVSASDGVFYPQGTWGNDVINFHDPTTNLRIQCEFDENNNLAILNVKKCGIRIQFRPYDCELRRNQPQVPYISYGVNCAFQPEFLSQDKVVAIPPVADHGGMTINDLPFPGMTNEEKLVYRALCSMAEQNTPDHPNPQCALSKSKLDNCADADVPTAMSNCMFILTLPRFIRCYDPSYSGVPIMELYNTCIDVYCGGFNCMDFIAMITGSNCHLIDPPYPEVDEVVTGALCP